MMQEEVSLSSAQVSMRLAAYLGVWLSLLDEGEADWGEETRRHLGGKGIGGHYPVPPPPPPPVAMAELAENLRRVAEKMGR